MLTLYNNLYQDLLNATAALALGPALAVAPALAVPPALAPTLSAAFVPAPALTSPECKGR